MSEELNLELKELKLDVVQSPVDERDWKVETTLYVGTFPEILDPRHDMLPVRDQGRQGSCAAMSGAAMKEVQERVDMGIKEYFSPQYIYNLRNNQDSSGMFMRDLMKILKNDGDCLEKTYPYNTTGEVTEKARSEASKYVIKSYAAIDTIDGLKEAIWANGAAIIAVPVYNYSKRMWKQDEGDEFLGGHAMCVIGYTDEGFIIRNSWSDRWGDGGYTILPYGDWDLIWELWTTIDVVIPKPEPVEPEPIEPEPVEPEDEPTEPESNDNFIVRFFKWIASLFN